MKFVKVLIVALGLMMVAATSSFAIAPYFTTSTSNNLAPNAQTGLVGNVVLTQIAAGTLSEPDSISISYSPAVISCIDDISINVGGAIFGVGGLPIPGYGSKVTALSGVSVTVNKSNILIGLPAGLAPTQISVTGVRVKVDQLGAAVGTTLTASVSSATGQAPVTNPVVQVATFAEPLALSVPTSFGVPVIANFNTAGVAGTQSSTTLSIKEAGTFTNAFETKGATAPTEIVVRISNIPVGLQLNSDTATTNPTVLGTLAAGVDAAIVDVTQTGSTATITLAILNQNPDLLDTIPLVLNFSKVTGTTTVPLGTATAAATLAPPMTATQALLVAPFGCDLNGLRYAERFTTPETNVLRVFQLQTQLLSIFNVVNSDFNTGFAIANTTGILQASTQPGTITVTLYPLDGTASKSFTTSATKKPGLGLDANGNLPGHAEWAVLLSELVTAAGFTGNFEGQVLFTCNFTQAHGINFVADADFATQAQGYEMLVLEDFDIFGNRNIVAPEGLGH